MQEYTSIEVSIEGSRGSHNGGAIVYETENQDLLESTTVLEGLVTHVPYLHSGSVSRNGVFLFG